MDIPRGYVYHPHRSGLNTLQVRKANSLRSPPSARPQLAHQLSDQGPAVNSSNMASNAGLPQGNLVTTVTVGDTQYAQPFRHRRSLSSKSRREIRNRLLSSNSAANLKQVSFMQWDYSSSHYLPFVAKARVIYLNPNQVAKIDGACFTAARCGLSRREVNGQCSATADRKASVARHKAPNLTSNICFRLS